MDHDLLTTIVKKWVDAYLPKVIESGWYDDHVTSIIGTSHGGAGEPDSIDVAIQGFSILLDYIGQRDDIRLRLAIPLDGGKRTLKKNYPVTKHDIYTQWNSFEAPSLYMYHWKTYKYAQRSIQYVHPLPYLESEFSHPVTAFYREWRSIALPPNWEFTRTVIVESL